MGTKTLISVEEFDRLQEPEELRYELDCGELLEMTKPKFNPHNRIVMQLTKALLSYLQQNPIGEVLSSDNLFVLGPSTKRIPDLSFMTMDRIKQIGNQDIQGAPDLAIEVLSPNDSAAAMRRKVKQYFAAGCKLVWVAYPDSREVEVWDSELGPARVLGEKDSLTAETLLPGLAIAVADVFPA